MSEDKDTNYSLLPINVSFCFVFVWETAVLAPRAYNFLQNFFQAI